jgi:NAD(P)-dependent dehydrogenase (short-subunit alcohol dehydrogenase family)
VLQQALQRFGEVDILVNCVAKIRRAPTLTFPEDNWTDILDTNLTGTLRSCQIFGQSRPCSFMFMCYLESQALRPSQAFAHIPSFPLSSCQHKPVGGELLFSSA